MVPILRQEGRAGKHKKFACQPNESTLQVQEGNGYGDYTREE